MGATGAELEPSTARATGAELELSDVGATGAELELSDVGATGAELDAATMAAVLARAHGVELELSDACAHHGAELDARRWLPSWRAPTGPSWSCPTWARATGAELDGATMAPRCQFRRRCGRAPRCPSWARRWSPSWRAPGPRWAPHHGRAQRIPPPF
ncbi:MAG: hypothetical protein ACJ8AT_34090 [Hyalangium sp.]|uniref:hypothetical protein n=1 Tax=Hyalangium sp. TaxID=2028555 RepID=UPI00389AD43D